jgi:hypothetical protein
LTLNEGFGQTVYFSNRPERKFGAMATPKFFEAMDFNTVPPNGALVFESVPGEEDVVVLELTAPVYDAAMQAVTYAATVLADYEGLGDALQETPQTAGSLPSRFGAASLFLDNGCGQHAIWCCAGGVGPDQCYNKVGSLSPDFCWNFGDFCCHPCSGGGEAQWSEYCNNNFAACNGKCQAYPWGGCW